MHPEDVPSLDPARQLRKVSRGRLRDCAKAQERMRSLVVIVSESNSERGITAPRPEEGVAPSGSRGVGKGVPPSDFDGRGDECAGMDEAIETILGVGHAGSSDGAGSEGEEIAPRVQAGGIRAEAEESREKLLGKCAPCECAGA